MFPCGHSNGIAGPPTRSLTVKQQALFPLAYIAPHGASGNATQESPNPGTIVPTDRVPAGPAGTNPVAPALTNAVADATGLRGRDLPPTRERTFRPLAEQTAR
jgi:hypothetical protein